MTQLNRHKTIRVMNIIFLLFLVMTSLTSCQEVCYFQDETALTTDNSTLETLNQVSIVPNGRYVKIGDAQNSSFRNIDIPLLVVKDITGLLSINTYKSVYLGDQANIIIPSFNILYAVGNYVNQCNIATTRSTDNIFYFNGSIANLLKDKSKVGNNSYYNMHATNFYGFPLFSNDQNQKNIFLEDILLVDLYNNNSLQNISLLQKCSVIINILPKDFKFALGSQFLKEAPIVNKISLDYKGPETKITNFGKNTKINNSFNKMDGKFASDIYATITTNRYSNEIQTNIMGILNVQTSLTTTKEKGSSISGYLSWFFNYIVVTAQLASNELYNTLVKRLNIVVSAMLSIYISISGISYLAGLSQMTQKDFMTKAIKIGIVILVMQGGNITIYSSESSNEAPIYIYFMSFFINALRDVFGFIQNTGAIRTAEEASAFLEPLMKTFHVFYNGAIWSKLLLGIVTVIGVFVIVYAIIIVIEYTIITLKVVVTFIICTIMTYILFSMAPIFISFILFERTKGFFQSWVKLILSLTMQPIFVIIAFFILNELILTEFLFLLTDPICWERTNLPIELSLSSFIPILKQLLNFVPFDLSIKLNNLYWFGYKNQIAFIASCIIIFIYVKCMRGIIDFCAIMAEKITIGTMRNANVMSTENANQFDPGVEKAANKFKARVKKGYNSAANSDNSSA